MSSYSYTRVDSTRLSKGGRALATCHVEEKCDTLYVFKCVASSRASSSNASIPDRQQLLHEKKIDIWFRCGQLA